MAFWGRIIIVGFVCFITNSVWSQFYMDTVGHYLQFRQGKGEDVITEINLKDIHFDYVNVRAKGKLGSYSIRFKHATHSSKKVSIISFDHKAITFSVNGKKMSITQSENTLNSSQLHFCSLENDSLNNHWNISFVKTKNASFVGGGMQFSNVVRNDYKMVHLSEENGIGRGSGSLNKWTRLAKVNGKEHSTYCPVAYLNSGEIAFELVGHHYSEMTVHKTSVQLDVFSKEVILNVYDAYPNGKEADLSYSMRDKSNSLLNKEKLPSWALGTIVGLQGGTERVKEKLNFLLDKGAHIDAVWIQDWIGKQPTKFGSRLQWKWQLDETSYSEFSSFKKDLATKKIKLLGYINPFFAEEGVYSKEGVVKGYFVQNELGETERFNFGGMNGYMLDIFNPAAYAWMKNIIKTNLINNGFDGWMADFGEWYPIEKGRLFSASVEKHNQYPVLWAKLNREVINESGKELIFFNRSGGYDTWKYSNMMWLGDQLTDYSKDDGLPSVFNAYLSSTSSGLPWVHSDVGGYTSVNKPIIKKVIRDENLLKDWMLLEAFTPVFRTHEGLLPSENSQVYDNENIATIFARFTNIHHALIPYFEKNSNPNFSILFAHLENDLVGDYAFKMGNDLIIAYEPNFTMLKSIQWKLVSNEGKLTDTTLPNQKIVVLVRKGSEVEKVLQDL